MAEDKRPALVVCCSVDDPYHNGMPGSVERTCVQCSVTVLVAPSTIEIMRNLNAEGRYVEVQCVACGAPQLRKPTTELVTFPEQVTEAAAWDKARGR